MASISCCLVWFRGSCSFFTYALSLIVRFQPLVCASRLKSVFLLRLDAEDEGADGNLFVGSNVCAFLARQLIPSDHSRVTTYGNKPIAIVRANQNCVHTTHFRIPF